MKPNQLRVAAVAIVWCGLICYALTGLPVAMFLLNPPSNSTTWFPVIGLWVVTTVLIIIGNLFLVRAFETDGIRLVAKVPPSAGMVRRFGTWRQGLHDDGVIRSRLAGNMAR